MDPNSFNESPTVPMQPGAASVPPIPQTPPRRQAPQQPYGAPPYGAPPYGTPPYGAWPPAALRTPAPAAQQRMPRDEAQSIIRRLKRTTVGAALAAFVVLVGLAAQHVTGVTAAAQSAPPSQNNNPFGQSAAPRGDDGGFFGNGNGTQQNNGGFFGSGGGGGSFQSPATSTGTS
jgi:hypothetical protein